jgi:superfamily II RNA helicase
MNSDIFNGSEFSPLSGTEFHQMTGRAGRRGQDQIGFMLTVPGRFMDMVHVRKLLTREPEAIVSQIHNDFSMILNLLLSQTPEDIRKIFSLSFASYQRQHGEKENTRQGPQTDLWGDFQRHLLMLKEEGFVDNDDRLTENGVWASKLRLDQPLLIAECLRQGVLPRNDEKLFAATIAPFVYDGDQDVSLVMKDLPGRLTRACRRVFKAVSPLSERLKERDFPVSPLTLWPATIIYDWAMGGDWDRIIKKTGIAEGDMAMLILRTADNLRQLMSLRETHMEIAAMAAGARAAILREPVIF